MQEGVRERPIEAWPDALERACAATRIFRTVHVLRETDSTQDAAGRLAATPGTLVTTGRQVAGRGRLGARWADTADDGVACTFVIEALAPERLAMSAAVAVALAARDVVAIDTRDRLGLKWPNDLLAEWHDGVPRKIAGVLVEVREGRALVGIGVNVAHATFDGDLATRAASLRMLGAQADRLAVIERLLLRVDEAIALQPAELESRFRSLDRTAGLRMRFRTPQGELEGEVVRCDPAKGLLVRTTHGESWLAAATTRVEPQCVARRTTVVEPSPTPGSALHRPASPPN